MKNKTESKRLKRFIFCVNEKEKEKINIAAHKLLMSQSEFVRMAINEKTDKR